MARLSWTTERVAVLRDLHSKGYSAAEIEAAIGLTRNAVLGKIHRLGLAESKLVLSAEEKERRRLAKIEQDRDRWRARAGRKLVVTNTPKPGHQPAEFAGSLHLPFGELRPLSAHLTNQCRFPEGAGPNFLYCGSDTLPGESCCEHHNTIMRAAPEPRRRAATQKPKRSVRSYAEAWS